MLVGSSNPASEDWY